MIRRCDGTDPNLREADGTVGNCGRTFDDVNHWTTCPHDEFPINPAAQALIDDKARRGAAVEGQLIGIVAGNPAVPASNAAWEGTHVIPGDVAEDGSRTYGMPGWTRADNGRWYPPTQTPAETLRAEIEAGGVDAIGSTNTADAGPGPGYHQHDDGSWHPDANDGGPCEPPTGVDGEPISVEDQERIRRADARYQAAVHAVQSGVAALMRFNTGLGDPKHLRVGVDTAKVEQSALVGLLISRGLFTLPEYFEAIAESMEGEVRRSEDELSRLYGGTRIRLQ